MVEQLTDEDKSNIEFALNSYLIIRNVDYAICPTINRRLELDMFKKLLEKVKQL